MKSKFLFPAILMIFIFSQFSFTVFAADANQKLFDKAWDNAVNSKQRITACTISVPFAKIDPKISASLSEADKQIAKFDVAELKRYKFNASSTFNESDHIYYFSSKTLDVFTVDSLYSEKKITFKEAMKILAGSLNSNIMEVISGVGDKIYYRIDKQWKVFEDHEFASNDYAEVSASSIGNFLDKDTLAFYKKANGQFVYKGKASESSTVSLLDTFLNGNLPKNLKRGNAQLFISSKGDWKKIILESNFKFNNVLATAKEVCTFDFSDKKVTIPSNALPVDKETGLKELG